MSGESRERKSLSKNLLKMKFMQRTEEAKLRQQLEEEEKREIDEAHWVIDNIEDAEEDMVEYEPSYVVCENLVPTGRMSFKKFNPAIEKLFKELTSQKELAECEAREMLDTVSVEEMTERYDSLIDTVGKKFGGKRKRHQHFGKANIKYENSDHTRPSKKHKAQFKKPKED